MKHPQQSLLFGPPAPFVADWILEKPAKRARAKLRRSPGEPAGGRRDRSPDSPDAKRLASGEK